MTTASEIMNRIIRRMFKKYSEQEVGITKMGPHRLPGYIQGRPDFGHVYFECGSVSIFLNHDVGKSFRFSSLGYNNSLMTGYPMPLIELYCTFDELPDKTLEIVELTFSEYPRNNRAAKTPLSIDQKPIPHP